MYARLIRAAALVVLFFSVVSSPFLGAPASGLDDSGRGWLGQVEQQIVAQEYDLSWQTEPMIEGLAPAWHAPNRAHGFRTYFSGNSVRLIPRSAPQDWIWTLELVRYGRRGFAATVQPAQLSTDGNRIRFDRGPVHEWYVNTPAGLEQGFTLFKSPAPSGDAPLILDIAVEGSLTPRYKADGQAIEFASDDGVPVIRYSKLLVTDATDRELPARMEGFGQAGQRGIRLIIDDAGAVYPLTVDPLATSASWTADGGQADARFGSSVAAAGDVNGDGWGDVIVGALFYDNGQTDEGRAFLYHGAPGGPSLVADWTAEADQDGARFGISVATAGDINGDGYSDVIVGADMYDNGEVDEGVAFIYLGSATGLSLTADDTIESDQMEAGLGRSVSTAGDVNGDGYADVIVGARFYDNGQSNEGRALVFHGSSTGLSATADWTAESNQIDGNFAFAVSMAGDVNADGYGDVLIGSPLHDNPQADEGQARLYLGSASGLATGSAWATEGNQIGAEHGWSVATAGDVNGDGYADVVVGSRGWDGGQVDEGRALVYHGSASGLPTTPDWSYLYGQGGAWLGYSVATAGDINHDGYADVLVGLPKYHGGLADQGRAFMFRGSSTGLAAEPEWTVEGNQAGAELGYSVATAGDANGDGFSDVIVGARLHDGTPADEGRATIYFGSDAGTPATTASWSSTEAGGGFFSVGSTTIGDINGDGYADVLVPNFAQAWVYHGSPTGPSLTSDRIVLGHGNKGSAAGDVNGDGYDDLLIGGGSNFSVFHGSPTGLSAQDDWQVPLYSWVAAAGDVNGDGYADIVGGDTSTSPDGRAFLYLGSATGLSTILSSEVFGPGAGTDFGSRVSGAGDVNGDGYADVLVGASFYEDAQSDRVGRVYVYHGSASGLPAVADQILEGAPGTDERLGYNLYPAGDVNGDGYSDILAEGIVQSPFGYFQRLHLGSSSGVSATAAWDSRSVTEDIDQGRPAGDVNADGYADLIYRETLAQFVSGSVIFFGSPSGIGLSPGWSVANLTPEFELGVSGNLAGDVNGDGYGDVILGSYDTVGGSLMNTGEAFVYLGNGGGGVDLVPQQRRSDDSAPIAHQGGSQDSAFRLAARGIAPVGRARVKLQWEVKPFGTDFDGNVSGASASWQDTGTTGVALNELVTGLTGGSYHWRMRLLYDPSNAPYQASSRWFWVPWNGRNEFDLRTTTPVTADVTVTQTDDADPVVDGNDVIYTVTVANAGPQDALVQLTDTLPAGAAFVSATPSAGNCNENAGIVTCDFGLIALGGMATVDVQITPNSPGLYTNVATASGPFTDPVPSDNSASEETTVVGPAIGNRVWEDLDGDGLQDAGEPGVVSALVALIDSNGFIEELTFTDLNGNYSFSVDPGSWSLRFFPPAGYVLSPVDVGGDDELDSDADPLTGDTPSFSPTTFADASRWDAGVVPSVPCIPPDEAIYLYDMTLSTDGNNYPILHYMDFNQPDQVTGYNVYRSADAGIDPLLWPLVASDVIDGDEATPNKQWVDSSGDVSPSGVWYYDVAAYNNRCPAQGPR